MNIRRGTKDDVENLAVLFDRYRLFYKQPSDVEGCKQFLADRIRKDEAIVFMAEDQTHKLIGFTLLYPVFTSLAMQRMWILNDLFVDPAARKQGVGKMLMNKAQEFAGETNARGLFLQTANDNLPAQALYRAQGWKQDTKFLTFTYAAKR